MVGAMINTAEANVGLSMKYFVDSKFYAVYRRATRLPGLYIQVFKNVHFVHAKGKADCDGVPGSALRFIGRNHNNFSKIFYCFY